MFFIVFLKEKGNTSKISLSKELIIDMKARNKHRVSVFRCFETVLVFLCLFTNRTSWELKSLLSLFFLFLFFSNTGLQIGDAAYLWMRLIHGLLQYVKFCPLVCYAWLKHYKWKQTFLLCSSMDSFAALYISTCCLTFSRSSMSTCLACLSSSIWSKILKVTENENKSAVNANDFLARSTN